MAHPWKQAYKKDICQIRPSAAEEYFSVHSRILDALDQLQVQVQDMQAPDESVRIDWGHVGSARKALEKIVEACSILVEL